MILILNVYSRGECAKVYVIPEKNDTAFTWSPGINMRSTLTIWHTPNDPAMQADWFAYERLFDNDFSISFQSTVPYATFCTAFRQSAFNLPQNYRMLNHNCAMAAHHALHLAGISIPLPWLQPVGLFPPVLVPPSLLLTPSALFNAAKKWKLQHNTTLSMDQRFFQSTLPLYARQPGKPELDNTVDTILTELKHRYKKRPHHAEHYVETLAALASHLQSNQSPETRGLIIEKATFFRHRPKPPHFVQAKAQLECSLLFCLAVILLTCTVDQTATNPFSIAMCYGLLAMFFTNLFHDKRAQVGLPIQDTRLSNALLRI